MIRPVLPPRRTDWTVRNTGAWISLGLSFCFILTVGLSGESSEAEGCFELCPVVVKCMKRLSGQGEQRDAEKKTWEHGNVRLLTVEQISHTRS